MRKFKNLRSIKEADAADYVKKPDDDEEATDYKPRSDGEAEFAAKHKGTTGKHPHADENQFKAVDVDHVDHKDAESDNVGGEKQPVKSGTKTFSNFRQATQTPLRRGDKRQGDFKAVSVKEEVDLDEAKKVTKKQLRDLEDRNEHGLVALKLAQSFGTPAEVKKIQDINKRHNMKGHIEYKDQKERDAIASKYWKMAEEVDLDEEDIIQKYRIEVSKLEAKKNKTSYEIDRLKKMKQRLRKIDEEVEFIEEAVKAGTIKLENGKSVKVTKEDAAAFNVVLKELNPDNRKRMESEMMKDEKSYKNMLTFVKRTM